ncbi:MAG: response regulator [Treponema sp.]|nr:response regulator [Treponema sp.]
MKQVLIIDDSPLFRDYLKEKLSENQIDAVTAAGGLDGMAKIRNLTPDLVIMDYYLKGQGCIEILRQKKENPASSGIPVIILVQQIDQKKIIELSSYNVKKVFTKPVKVDALFGVLSEILGVEFVLDQSPGIVEVHVNDDIIFAEIARGLNRDKLDMLGFKIVELIDLYQIRVPKVIVMLSDIKLNFADGPNIEKLLTIIVNASRAKKKHIRILTRDSFTRKFIEDQEQYEGIEVVSNLQYAVDGLLSELDGSMEYAEKKAEIIGDKLLSPENTGGQSMQLRFERKISLNPDDMKEMFENLRIAAVDDDFVIQELIKTVFSKTGAEVTCFSDGREFTQALENSQFDLVFLDLLMPKMDGFAVLRELKEKNVPVPVIVLSAINQRETVIRAFQMGTKSYLSKPLKGDALLKKSIEILKVNF